MASSAEAPAPVPSSASAPAPASSSSTLTLPVVDLAPLLELPAGAAPSAELLAAARAATDALHRFGVLVVRDPRAPAEANARFLDLLERYFGQDEEAKARDVRKEVYYQVGRTPERTELPRNHCARIAGLDLGAGREHAPLSLCPPEKDRKERFMRRVGPRPERTAFAQLHAEPVLPAAQPDFADVCDAWGGALLGAAEAVAELAALGAGLPRDAFRRRMHCGAHLLAPTGSDFAKFGAEGTVLAGYHYDLNFLTVHGRSRFPGLFVWTRGGERLSVAIPEGCLLVQAAKQFEHLTGGPVLAGFHEVVVSRATVAAIEAARAAGRSLWRVSSTLFAHICSDELLEPLGEYAALPSAKDYPPILCGDHVNAELAAINLGAGSDGEGGDVVAGL